MEGKRENAPQGCSWGHLWTPGSCSEVTPCRCLFGGAAGVPIHKEQDIYRRHRETETNIGQWHESVGEYLCKGGTREDLSHDAKDTNLGQKYYGFHCLEIKGFCSRKNVVG